MKDKNEKQEEISESVEDSKQGKEEPKEPKIHTEDEMRYLLNRFKQLTMNHPNIDSFHSRITIPMIKMTQNKNLLDNYNWRTIGLEGIIKDKWSGFSAVKDRHGRDGYNTIEDEFLPLMQNIEIKTQKEGSFLFDKQNDEVRRQKTLEYDGFVFSRFSNYEEVEWILMGVEKQTVTYITSILQQKQEDKVKDMEKKQKEGKRGYDSINLTEKDLLKSEKVTWNLYIDETWYTGITSESVLPLLRKK